ncbi:hypothetical protein SLA2020_068690 [Shorea laevis]
MPTGSRYGSPTHTSVSPCDIERHPLVITGLILLVHFLPRKNHHHGPSKNLTLALNQALTFFDAQKSGNYPSNSTIKFRGNSGLQDGDSSKTHADLVGGFYDSGNNIKFTFSTAFAITLLSWSVIEYHQKYSDIGELDHVKDIIRWGSDCLLKVFVPLNASSGAQATLYSQQVGSTRNDVDRDIKCWQRSEDMRYERPVSVCDGTASDLAGGTVAALEDKDDTPTTYTSIDACGVEARKFYNSSTYKDELVWGGTWLFSATGNSSYLQYAVRNFAGAVDSETESEKGIFYWNNKLTASAVLLTRRWFFHDLGYPYEDAFGLSSDITGHVMCSYLFEKKRFNRTQGGLILLSPDCGQPLQFAAMASFLSKLYSDYLLLIWRSGGNCSNIAFSVEMLQSFSISQVNYILGDNPMRISYMVGFGDHFPTKVHHRSASVHWDNQHYPSSGDESLQSKDPNPNILVGAMNPAARASAKEPWFTEPSTASNAGLVAALIALHDPPHSSSSGGLNFGIDQMGIFESIH